MVQLNQITKKFDSFTALDNIDLTIPTGSCFGLLGSNGAGKSTILRLIAGIYRQDSGTVTVDGENVFDNIYAKERIFFINDETVQFQGMTLNELKSFYMLYYPKFSTETFEKLNGIIKLPPDKKMGTFSKGMKRQAIVITALSSGADYLMLDEAFDGLDPTMRIIVKRMLVDAMIDRQLTAIISSHNLKEINEVCDTVALLHKGKIIFSRELDSVKSNIHKIQTAFNREYTKDDFPGMEILHFERSHSVYHIITKGESVELEAMLADKNPLFVDIVPLSLEEIFIYEMEGLGYDFNAITEKDALSD